MLLIYNYNLKFWSFVTKNDTAPLGRVVEVENAICLSGSWARAILHFTSDLRQPEVEMAFQGLFCLTALLSPCSLPLCHFSSLYMEMGCLELVVPVLLPFLYNSSILRTVKSRFPTIIIFSFLFNFFFKFSKIHSESMSEFLLLLKTL